MNKKILIVAALAAGAFFLLKKSGNTAAPKADDPYEGMSIGNDRPDSLGWWYIKNGQRWQFRSKEAWQSLGEPQGATVDNAVVERYPVAGWIDPAGEFMTT